MKLLVLGAGMMGSAAAYDMAHSQKVESVTLADWDMARVKQTVNRINKLVGEKKVTGVQADAARPSEVAKLMRQHTGMLSAVPYFHNLNLCRAAIGSNCHFVDLGGNHSVVSQEYTFSRMAYDKGVAIAPDCGLSPGMASILAGELMRRVGGRADALKIYVGGLPENPKPPFYYQLVFSVEGLINEYIEPAKILRGGKIQQIEPLTELENVFIPGINAELVAFHTSGGTSTLPDTFKGKVGECFEKTLRYPAHFPLIRALYDFGYFSSQKIKVGKIQISPRAVTTELFLKYMSGDDPDLMIMRVEAHNSGCITSFTVVDHYDPKTRMTSMMRTTAWPASIVLQMICSNQISKRGGIYQELDVPAMAFIEEMEARGVRIDSSL